MRKLVHIVDDPYKLQQVQSAFRTKITKDTLFLVLVDVKHGETYHGNESGYIIGICNLAGIILESTYPYIWNYDKFVVVKDLDDQK